jgi:hypothetical protein
MTDTVREESWSPRANAWHVRRPRFEKQQILPFTSTATHAAAHLAELIIYARISTNVRRSAFVPHYIYVESVPIRECTVLVCMSLRLGYQHILFALHVL